MKKSIQKIVAFMFMLSMIAFTGCGKSDKNKEDESGQVTLKLGIWPEATQTDEIKLHEKYVEDFKTKYPDINIIPANYKYATDTFVSFDMVK